MRFREPFTVFPRRRKDGRVVYYYRIYDEDGNRLPPRSAETTSPSAARKYFFTKWKEGTLIPSKDITFQDGMIDHDSLIYFIDSVLLNNRDYWKGTSSELYQELMSYVRSKNLPLSDYPKSAGVLTQALKRRVLILKKLGISIEETRTEKEIQISIKSQLEKTKLSCYTV